MKKIFGSLALTFTLSTHPYDVIFDLGGVIVDTDMSAVLQYIGPQHCIHYACFNTLSTARTRFYDLLQAIMPNESEIEAYDEHGKQLPALLCRWLQGKKTSTEINHLICQFIESNPTFFANSAEQTFLSKLCSLTFTPEHFVQSRYLHKSMCAFVCHLKSQGHRVYILSNWDAESFELLRKKHEEFFDQFSGICLSGNSGYLKPHPESYKTLLKTWALKVDQCIFIDDQMCNIQAAQKFGMKAIHCASIKTWWGQEPDIYTLQNAFNNCIEE